MQEVVVSVGPIVDKVLNLNREEAHVHVMAAYRHVETPVVTDRQGVARVQGPREALGITWYYDSAHRALTVRSREPAASPGLLGDVQESRDAVTPVENTAYELCVLIACQKTPVSDVPAEIRAQLKQGVGGPRSYRSRSVIVPEDERVGWATTKLARIGFTADESLQVSPLWTCPLDRRGRGIPAVEISARGRLTDVDAFSGPYANGWLKGKNYGLGLIRIGAIAS